MKTLKVMLLVMLITAVASPVYADEAEGCTPGFWKNHLDSWVTYTPDMFFSNVFGVGPDITLLEVLNTGGGGEEALGRQSVAAILNGSHPEINYELTDAEVIALVQDAYATGEFEDAKDLLEELNESGCPEEEEED